MIQHLLNTTAIWLLCLLAFDLFLRKETFHAYNRFFLLLTFVVGLLLPFWEWGADSVVFSDTLREPVTSVVNAKHSIEVATVSSAQWDWEAYVRIVYLVGVSAALFFLLADVFKVISLYRKGIKSSMGHWTIIETSGKHGPFSVFNLLFVSSKERYTEEEWNILLIHEQQHRKRLHFIDLLLMQLSRILFWFHPLVYLYNKRLMIVHEYEADSAIKSPLKEYGQFLIEQALLGNAPHVAHSINRSPIKKRITMLTRNSNNYKKIKLLIGLPVLLASIMFFTRCANSREKKMDGNAVIYNGYKIELSEPEVDTVEVSDPVTGETFIMYEQKSPIPVKCNGKTVYGTEALSQQPAMKEGRYMDYLKEKIKPAVEKLPDGKYLVHTSNVVLDEKGNVIYYEFSGISTRENEDAITDEIKSAVSKELEDAFDNLPISPGKLDGKQVITFLDGDFIDFLIVEIKDHKMQ